MQKDQPQHPQLQQQHNGALQGLPGSREPQKLPPDMAQILAEGAEVVEAMKALTPAANNELFAKEVANVLHSMKSTVSHDAAETGAAGPEPEPSSGDALGSQVLGQMGKAAAAAAPAAESNGAPAAVTGTDLRAAGSQAPAGQLAKLQGPQGNPLPSRRAGPAARSHSRRSMHELGFGIVEEEGKLTVDPLA